MDLMIQFAENFVYLMSGAIFIDLLGGLIPQLLF